MRVGEGLLHSSSVAAADRVAVVVALLCLLSTACWPDLSERSALNCFTWSRMVVEESGTVRAQRREAALPFEGFMEAVCHLATLKVRIGAATPNAHDA